MREYIRNGVTSLDEIRSHYNAYGEGGLMQPDGNPKMTFKQWIEKMHEKYPWLELNSTMAGYDYERYFNENYDDAIARLYEDEPSHFTDRYKLPNHPTFSNESMYSIPYTPSPLDPSTVNYGGRWTDNIFETPNPRQTMMDRLQKIAKGERPESMFIPSETNKQQYPYIYTDNRPYNEYEIYDAYRNELNKQRADISVMVANNSDYGRDRKINEENLRRLDDYLIRLGLPKIQRQAVLFSVQQENGGETGPHGNGAYGLIGWRGSRKDPIIDQELSTNGNIVLKGLEDQAQYLYNTLTEFDSDSWGGGGIYKDGIEAQKAFMNATDLEEAARALNFGYVRSDEADNLYRTQNTKNIWTPKQIDIENTAPRFDLGGGVPPWFGKTSKDMFADAFRKYQEENPIYTGKPLQPVEVTAERLPNAGVTDDNVRRYADYVNQGFIGLKDIPNVNLRRATQVRGFQNDWQNSMADITPKVLAGTFALPAAVIGAAELAPLAIQGARYAWKPIAKVLSNPYVDAGLTLHGAITAPGNIKEGIGDIRDKRYGRGAFNLGLTALDLYGAGKLAKHGYDATKRLAEVFVRQGDALHGMNINGAKKLLTNKNTLNYVFNGWRHPELAYLTGRYSGNAATYYGDPVLNSTPHKGDVVDAFFGKSRNKNEYVKELKFDDLSKEMQEYINKKYKRKKNKIKIFDLGDDIENPGGLSDSTYSAGLSKRRNNQKNFYLLDPGGFHEVRKYGNHLRNEDIWKYNWMDYFYNNRGMVGSMSLTPDESLEIAKKLNLSSFLKWGKLIPMQKNMLLKKYGLKFIDSMGTPVVHVWRPKQFANTTDNITGFTDVPKLYDEKINEQIDELIKKIKPGGFY